MCTFINTTFSFIGFSAFSCFICLFISFQSIIHSFVCLFIYLIWFIINIFNYFYIYLFISKLKHAFFICLFIYYWHIQFDQNPIQFLNLDLLFNVKYVSQTIEVKKNLPSLIYCGKHNKDIDHADRFLSLSYVSVW